MNHPFFFSLHATKPQKDDPGGTITYITADEMSGLVNLSFANLTLKKQGTQEPLWHPNANKIGYCVEGHALVSIRTPEEVERFTVQAGDVFFIPEGYVHHIANLGENDTIISFALNHVKPQTMRLSQAIYSLNDRVFSSTFNTEPSFFAGLTKNKTKELIKTLPINKDDPSFIANRFKFNIAASSKPVLTKGGYLQLATKTNLPVLEGLGILGFGLNPKGIVEPHWHTNAGELVYIVKGHTRITVLSPDGHVDVLEVSGGEGAFAPASYFHNIENIGDDNVEVIAFFSDAQPNYIGIGEVIGSYSNQVLASIFNVPATYFDQFKKPQGPLIIVPI
jgi:oxalate decarboxylase